MREILLASAAAGALALCFAVTAAEALPALGGKLATAESFSDVQQIAWKRVCDRRGRHCHRIWVRQGRDDWRGRDRR